MYKTLNTAILQNSHKAHSELLITQFSLILYILFIYLPCSVSICSGESRKDRIEGVSKPLASSVRIAAS